MTSDEPRFSPKEVLRYGPLVGAVIIVALNVLLYAVGGIMPMEYYLLVGAVVVFCPLFGFLSTWWIYDVKGVSESSESEAGVSEDSSEDDGEWGEIMMIVIVVTIAAVFGTYLLDLASQAA